MTCGSVIQVRNCIRAICSWALESKSGYALVANQLKASAYSIQLSEVLLWQVLKSARYSSHLPADSKCAATAASKETLFVHSLGSPC